MAKIDRSVIIELDGEEKKIRFDLSALEELEAKIGKSAMTMMQNPNEWGVNGLVTALWVALKSREKKLTREEVKRMVSEYINDGGEANALLESVYAAIGLSGFFGDVSIFKDMLKRNDDEDIEEGK